LLTELRVLLKAEDVLSDRLFILIGDSSFYLGDESYCPCFVIVLGSNPKEVFVVSIIPPTVDPSIVLEFFVQTIYLALYLLLLALFLLLNV